MIKDLEYYIYKFDNFFSNHFMNDTLENVKKLSFKEHLFYKNDTEAFIVMTEELENAKADLERYETRWLELEAKRDLHE